VRAVLFNQGIVIILFIFAILAMTAIFSGVHKFQNAQGQSQGEGSPDDGALQVTKYDVSGAYEYDSATVTIIFPEGWSGIEVSHADGSTLVAAVSPDEMVSLEDIISADPIMSLVVSKKPLVDRAPGTTPPLLAEINVEETIQCRVTSSQFIFLNGVSTEELFSECLDVNGGNSGSGSGSNSTSTEHRILHAILTQTSQIWVALTIYGTPEILEENEAEFKLALNSLKVLGARDMPIPFGYIKFNSFNVNANGSKIPVDVKSTTNITAFALDEENKFVSFRAEGVTRQGIAEISIGRVLEGPYVVAVNGQVWDDFDILNEENPKESKIQIRYAQEGSQIMIRGTQVVPEFSFGGILGSAGLPLILLLGGALASLILLGKFGPRPGAGTSAGSKT
jgi:hypothetical protein